MKNTASNKAMSLVILIGGIALMAAALVLDFTGSKMPARGAMLVIGMVATLLGMFIFPTLKHHRTIVNVVFLFPLLFTFGVTVIIPLCLGIFYSLTDWNVSRSLTLITFSTYFFPSDCKNLCSALLKYFVKKIKDSVKLWGYSWC